MKIAVVGATGAVGQEMMQILIERKFPVSDLKVFASSRSQGREILFREKKYSCQVLGPGCFQGLDLVFFDASDPISTEWVPQALAQGAWVVDHSAAFRADPQVPLMVPEVNGREFESWFEKTERRLVAGPNCSTVQTVMILKPISENWGLNRVLISTYQSVSGAGAAAMEELKTQMADVLQGQPARASVLAHPIAMNCIPQIGSFQTDGYTSEEHKLMSETRKILGLPGLKVSATAIRVPTLHCHAVSVQVECQREPDVAELRRILKKSPGVELVDEGGLYPMNLQFAGKDSVGVGRIRRDPALDFGLSFWAVADNLRKGAALNAIQIGEKILAHGIR